MLDGSEKCTDVDECLDQTHNCSVSVKSAQCLNYYGGYTCNCPSGKRLTTNLWRSWNCKRVTKVSLEQGYKLGNQTCVDVDECEEKLHQCPSGVAKCINQKGSHTCECPKGQWLIHFVFEEVADNLLQISLQLLAYSTGMSNLNYEL